MDPAVAILILAAGASSRMRGRDKLVTMVEGQPLLRRVAERALASGMKVTVTLPPEAPARRQALAGLALRSVEVPDAALGMSRSLSRGLAAVAAAGPGPRDGVMILPADMPDLTAEDLSRLIAVFRAEPSLIWRGATAQGQPGHPAIFPRDLWPALARVSGDEGGRAVIQANHDRLRLLPLPGRAALCDLDTPEDWAAYLGRPS